MTRKVLVSVVLIFGLMATLSVCLFAVLPPSITPVVFVAGTDYEMGYQYGQQAAPYIASNVMATWAGSLATFDNRDEIETVLRGLQVFIAEYAPETIEFMRGMADGATDAGHDITYTDILNLNSWLKKPTATWSYPEGAEDDELPPGPGQCANWSAWGDTTAGDYVICGNSCDLSEFQPMITVVGFPNTGNNFAFAAAAGEISGHPCINEAGVFLGLSGAFPRRMDEDYDFGIPILFAYHHLMRFASSADEAKDLFVAMKLFYCVSAHMADVSGRAFVVEKSAAGYAVRKPGDFGEDDFLYATNNFLTDFTSPSGEFFEHAGWGQSTASSSVSRNLVLWNMFSNYQGAVDLDFAKMTWRFPGLLPPLDPSTSWTTMIGRWMNVRVGIVVLEREQEPTLHLCTGPAGTVIQPRPGYRLIDGTHTFYEIRLSDTPCVVTEAAKRKAAQLLDEAYGNLMYLTVDDPQYAAIHGIYSKATSEYYSGIASLNEAKLVSGSAALNDFARATTSFTRAQAHSLQICNLLSLPATCPQDLRLAPWGFWKP